MGKHKHFKVKGGFLNFFAWNRNPCSCQIMGKEDFHSIGKVWENWNISNFFFFFNISREAEIHTILLVNLLSMGKVLENTEISHILRYLTDLELMRTYAIPNVWECKNFPWNGNIVRKAISFPACGFLRKLEVITKSK